MFLCLVAVGNLNFRFSSALQLQCSYQNLLRDLLKEIRSFRRFGKYPQKSCCVLSNLASAGNAQLFLKYFCLSLHISHTDPCFLKTATPSNFPNFKLSQGRVFALETSYGAHSMRLGPNFHSGMQFLKNLIFFYSWWPASGQ